MRIASITTGFIDLPNTTTMNIFAQGCNHKCKGCSNPSLQPFESSSSYELTNDLFIKELLQRKDLCQWICFLGGDASYQSSRVIQLAQIASKYNYHSCIYTGNLFHSDVIQSVSEYIDIVIDGKWNGIPITNSSSNQKIYMKQKCSNSFELISWGELSNAIRQYNN